MADVVTAFFRVKEAIENLDDSEVFAITCMMVEMCAEKKGVSPTLIASYVRDAVKKVNESKLALGTEV